MPKSKVVFAVTSIFTSKIWIILFNLLQSYDILILLSQSVLFVKPFGCQIISWKIANANNLTAGKSKVSESNVAKSTIMNWKKINIVFGYFEIRRQLLDHQENI